MKKIIIDPHYCSKEELGNLKEYLNRESWDWKTETPTSKQEEQLPNKIYFLEFTTDVFVKAKWYIVIAAENKTIAVTHLYEKLGILPRGTELIDTGAWYRTIWTRDGKDEEPERPKI